MTENKGSAENGYFQNTRILDVFRDANNHKSSQKPSFQKFGYVCGSRVLLNG
jgi:hypothetical protein